MSKYIFCNWDELISDSNVEIPRPVPLCHYKAFIKAVIKSRVLIYCANIYHITEDLGVKQTLSNLKGYDLMHIFWSEK